MTAMELDIKRMEVFREILDVEDENFLTGLIVYIRKAKKTAIQPPCQYTIEELRGRIAESVEDVKAGRVYSMEEVRIMFPRP
ncbi:MAG: hypothetical protein LBN71_00795 [Tannerella sp.]|jgi:hypothetical protein|nr:hypothetical protein [Tannerella sp.]